ncbi:MAG TPA: dihydroxy-acid dehydratase, partial [Clostridia bacterium]|nr:dihydroxy-acid dehydratase [Clostridia bacterium]
MNSDKIKKGVEACPKRSLLKAMGYTNSQIAKPLIGIVNSYNEVVPGHMHLKDIARAVKDGVLSAQGTPMEFNVIGVCDGLAMGHAGMKYSLSSREVIADSIECMAMAHAFDALVFIPNCDKIVPAMLMAAARINVPSIFVSGGPMLSLNDGKTNLDLNSAFEAVGSYMNKSIDEDELMRIEQSCCPTCGSCSGMFTANSMNCLSEALGMALSGNGSIPAVYSKRLVLAKTAGEMIMDILKKDIRPRDIMTKEAFVNALTVDMALGCSTNSVLHLMAIANEAEVSMDLNMVNTISSRTPNLCKLAPAGPYHMQDLDAAGGVYKVISELCKKNLINENVMTCTTKTMKQNLEEFHPYITKSDVIRPIEEPYSDKGGIAVLFGSLAPNGSVVKRSAVSAEMMKHRGPARVFDCEEDACSAIYSGKIQKGDV